MASLLRQIVAGPRARHPEAGLDLCYVTDNIIATSGPSGTYPQRAYRNPLDALVKFLDSKHGENWAIWEFRAEGTGYPDSEVYGRVWHFPWPDHHPPPFALIPNIMASMRNWLNHFDDQDPDSSKRTAAKEEVTKMKDGLRDKLGKEVKAKRGDRVVVVHCKAGKGRSGTIAASYLISEEGWTKEDALKRFTERRMRPGFGAGVSIPSQLRWIDYVVRWTKGGKLYVERQVEVCEVHLIGLRDGVKVSIEGFADEGRTIKIFHTFKREEREVVRGEINKSGFADLVSEVLNRKSTAKKPDKETSQNIHPTTDGQDQLESDTSPGTPNDAKDLSELQPAGADVIYRPSKRVVLPSNDINVDFERRNEAVSGFTMVTSVAHVWMNTFFEGNGPEQDGRADSSGVFEIEWGKIDGLKGSSKKGTRAFDKLQVVWKALEGPEASSHLIKEPEIGEEVKQSQAADWHGQGATAPDEGRTLGMRVTSPASEGVSRASSFRDETAESKEEAVAGGMDELDGVQSNIPGKENRAPLSSEQGPTRVHEAAPTASSDTVNSVTTEVPSSKQADSQSRSEPVSTGDQTSAVTPITVADRDKTISTADLPDGRPESQMKDAREHGLGHLAHHKQKY